jgi:hypothetical protein
MKVNYSELVRSLRCVVLPTYISIASALLAEGMARNFHATPRRLPISRLRHRVGQSSRILKGGHCKNEPERVIAERNPTHHFPRSQWTIASNWCWWERLPSPCASLQHCLVALQACITRSAEGTAVCLAASRRASIPLASSFSPCQGEH